MDKFCSKSVMILPLAMGAESGGSLADPNHAQSDTAFRTFSPCTAIDGEVVLIAAGGAICVIIIAERRTAVVDGLMEGCGNGVCQLIESAAGQISSRGQRVDTSAEKGFIGVDVPDSGNQALIKESGLNG